MYEQSIAKPQHPALILVTVKRVLAPAIVQTMSKALEQKYIVTMEELIFDQVYIV